MHIEKTEDNLNFTLFDFGDIYIGKKYSTTFIYTGEKEIKSIIPSCFCLSITKIKYLDRTEIKVTWNVKPTPKVNYRSKKKIDLILDDEELTLTLYGKIIQ